MESGRMPLYVCIIHESATRLWGLTSRQRVERVLRRAGAVCLAQNLESIPAESSVLLLRGDYLYDDRVLSGLVEKTDVLLQIGPNDSPVTVAAHVMSDKASPALEVLNGSAAITPSLSGIRTETPETVSPAYREKLRKSDPPFVLPITEETRHDLERHLFNWSYKGVTDLVTKWVWPRPAQVCTRICANAGIKPNHVTFISFLLVVIATALFAQGRFGWGLLAGWVMTFLDTVDGKLARVTITSSRFGHLFDHIIDLVHPPIWYIAWGIGLGVSYVAVPQLSLSITIWMIIAGYIAGRLVELTFTHCLGPFGMFCWRPVDSYFRLITARRNPNLIFLTTGAVSGYPAFGLLAVALWTVLTTIFLLLRLAMAVATRATSGPLHTWLLDVDKEPYRSSPAARLFARRAAPQSTDAHE